MFLSDRIFRYVERFALRHNLERYPTLREVARGLNTGARKVEEAVEEEGDGRMWTESYLSTMPPTTDETFVNVDSPKLDVAFLRIMKIDAQGRTLPRTQYLDRPPDACTKEFGEIRNWQGLLLRRAEKQIRTGRAYGYTLSGQCVGRYIWHEGGLFHIAVWQRQRWRLTIHGEDLNVLLDEMVRTYGHSHSPGNSLSLAGQVAEASRYTRMVREAASRRRDVR